MTQYIFAYLCASLDKMNQQQTRAHTHTRALFDE